METNSFPIYKDGEAVLYQNGDRFEIGIVKRKGNDPDTYFVWYHTGDTAACTHARNLHKIFNGYAYTILRRSVDDSIDVDSCRQLANAILDKLNDIVMEKCSEPLFDDFSDSESDEPSTEGLVAGSYYDMEDAVTQLIKYFN